MHAVSPKYAVQRSLVVLREVPTSPVARRVGLTEFDRKSRDVVE